MFLLRDMSGSRYGRVDIMEGNENENRNSENRIRRDA
jgi:hypothetical protein